MYLVEVHVKNDVEKKSVVKKARKQKVVVEKEYLTDKRLSIDLFAGDIEEENIDDFIKSFWDDMAIFHKPKKAQKRKPIQEVVIDEDQIEDIDEVEIEAPVKSSIAQSILFPTVHHRCFGFKLLRSKDINYTIHAFRRPCDVQEVNFNEPIQKLWSNDKLSSQNKKDIVNRTTGLCEKKYNSASVCKIFDSYAEAQFYQV